MSVTPRFFKGFFLAMLLNLVVLLCIYFFFEKSGSFAFFLESAWDLKTIVAYLSIASIPNILLFSQTIQQSNTDFAQGILVEIILVVIFIGLVKFVF